MGHRVLLVAVVCVAGSACGLGVVGVAGDAPSGSDASASGATTTSSGSINDATNGTDSGGPTDDGSTNEPDVSVDAAPDAATCGACPGHCDGATCVISCPGPGCPPDGHVMCPPNSACRLECLSDGACDKPACGSAASCTINCDGKNGCGGGASCDKAGSCSINCLNADACGGPVICQKANPGKACALFCGAANCGAYAYCCYKNACSISPSFQSKSTLSCDP